MPRNVSASSVAAMQASNTVPINITLLTGRSTALEPTRMTEFDG
jgi:hypothetical protein